MSADASMDQERREAVAAVEETRREVAAKVHEPHSGDGAPASRAGLPSLFGTSRRASVSTSGYTSPPPHSTDKPGKPATGPDGKPTK